MNTTKAKGFTIIEVVLVLAIAGLIFLMVFIALPTLQRNQRDTQRRDDMARMKSQISQYQANNKGAVPPDTVDGCTTAAGSFGEFIDRYMEAGYVATPGSVSPFSDPDGTDYQSARCLAPVTAFGTTAATEFGKGQWKYNAGATCGTTEGTFNTTAVGVRDFAIIMKLEGSGFSCIDSRN
jgi:prepilin-type N-terminal cleavage/methylation domain-containing protein